MNTTSIVLPPDIWRLILDELGSNNLWSLVLTAKFLDRLIEEFHEKKLYKLFKDTPEIIDALNAKKFRRLRHLYVTLMNLLSDTAVPQSLMRFLEDDFGTSDSKLAALYCIDDNLEEFKTRISTLKHPTAYLLLAVACRSHHIAKHFLATYKTEIENSDIPPKKFLDMAFYSGDERLVNLVYEVFGAHQKKLINFHTLKFAVYSGNIRLAQEVKTQIDLPRASFFGLRPPQNNDLQKEILFANLLNDYAIRSKKTMMVTLVLTWISPDSSVRLNAEALKLAKRIGKPDMINKVRSLLSVSSTDPLAEWENHLLQLKESAYPFNANYKSFLRLLRYIIEDASLKNAEHKKSLLLSVLFVAETEESPTLKANIQKILLSSNSGVKFEREEIVFCLKELQRYINTIQEFTWYEKIGESKNYLLKHTRDLLAHAPSVRR